MASQELPVYISGYTNDQGVGIYQYTFDPKTGVLTPKGLAVESVNPSYFAFHASNQHLYATNEVAEYRGEKTGYISAYTRNKETGLLTLVNEQPSGGEDPCHAIVDATGNYLLVANYSGGSATVFPIQNPGAPESSLGEAVSHPIHSETYKATFGVPDRQEKPHVHSVDLDPIAQKYVFCNDLGSDALVTYKFDRDNGSLANHSTFEFPKGSGPRHLKFAPNNNSFCYVISELSNEVYMLEFNFQEGKFYKVQQIYALPKEWSGDNLGSEIDITPNGKFLYVSMRGYDCLTIFEIDERTGKLILVGFQKTGKHPRHFTFDPTGSFILVGNKDSDSVDVFKINPKTGLLTKESSVAHVQPTCIKFWV